MTRINFTSPSAQKMSALSTEPETQDVEKMENEDVAECLLKKTVAFHLGFDISSISNQRGRHE